MRRERTRERDECAGVKQIIKRKAREISGPTHHPTVHHTDTKKGKETSVNWNCGMIVNERERQKFEGNTDIWLAVLLEARSVCLLLLSL